ncbi:MAG TPA: FtsX-like permease family protein [Candidatus Acidoferrales bacterium]
MKQIVSWVSSSSSGILAIAGVMAMAVRFINSYGVISYTMSQRRREIGIRLALEPQDGNVLQMLRRQSAKMTLVGVAIEVAAALGLTDLMTGLQFGVSPHDPLTSAAVAGVLIVVALLASYIPARRCSGRSARHRPIPPASSTGRCNTF